MENPQYKMPTQQKQEQETRSKTQIYVYYDWGHISEHEKPVTLDQAIDFLKKQPNKSQFESNFIDSIPKLATKLSNSLI